MNTMVSCDICGQRVNADRYPGGYLLTDYLGQYICPVCIEDLYTAGMISDEEYKEKGSA